MNVALLCPTPIYRYNNHLNAFLDNEDGFSV